MNGKALWAAIVLSICLIVSFFVFPNTGISNKKNSDVLSVTADVTVSASIGTEVSYSLFGYTSALASVTLDGIGITTTTRADSSGYFEFKNFLAPSSIREFCLTAIDTEGGVSPALCVPAPSDPTAAQNMGPYLLPPSIRTSSGSINASESVSITGKTIPNTDIGISLYPSETATPLGLIANAYAAAGAQKTVQTKAARDGSYSYTYRGDTAGKVRVFSRSKYSGQFTPKSNTLSFSILNAFMVLLFKLLSFLKKLLTQNTVIAFEILTIAGLLAYILFRRLCAHRKPAVIPVPPQNKYPIIPYEEPELLVVDYTKLKE